MYEVELHEVRALVANLLGDLLAEPDALIRYEQLTKEQALYDALVSEIKRLRGAALVELHEAGLTWEKVAEAASLGTRQRAEQLAAATKR